MPSIFSPQSTIARDVYNCFIGWPAALFFVQIKCARANTKLQVSYPGCTNVDDPCHHACTEANLKHKCRFLIKLKSQNKNEVQRLLFSDSQGEFLFVKALQDLVWKAVFFFLGKVLNAITNKTQSHPDQASWAPRIRSKTESFFFFIICRWRIRSLWGNTIRISADWFR